MQPDSLATATLERPKKRSLLSGSRKELSIFFILLAVCIATALKNHNFFGPDNFVDLTNLIGIYGIFSIGAAVVIITSGIDLSVGSMFALLGVILAIALNNWHMNQWAAVLGTIAIGMFLGSIHGVLITRMRLQPFVVTLCGLLIYRGLARFICGDDTEGFEDYAAHAATKSTPATQGYEALNNFATAKIEVRCDPLNWHPGYTIPMTFIVMLFIAAIMWVVIHRSVYGRYLLAVGRNEEAARYSGINAKRIVASAYVVAGLLTGIAGILLAFYTTSISPSSHGNSFELYGIAAAVLGGCSLRGGEGSVIGVILGTALLQVLQNLVNLLGIPSSLNFAVVGAVILLGVIADEIIKRQGQKKKLA